MTRRTPPVDEGTWERVRTPEGEPDLLVKRDENGIIIDADYAMTKAPPEEPKREDEDR